MPPARRLKPVDPRERVSDAEWHRMRTRDVLAVDIICGIAGFLDNSGEALADFDDMHDDIQVCGGADPPH